MHAINSNPTKSIPFPDIAVLIYVSQLLLFESRNFGSSDFYRFVNCESLHKSFFRFQPEEYDCVSRTGRQWPPIFRFFSPCGTRLFSSCDFSFLVGLLPETDSFFSRATALLTLSSTCSGAGLSKEFLVPLAFSCFSSARLSVCHVSRI